MFNPATPLQTIHMILAAFMVAGFGIASVYAAGMLRGRRDRYHRLGLLLPFTVAAIVAPVQIMVGGALARFLAHGQPATLAALEGLNRTGSHVPLHLGGLYLDGRLRRSSFRRPWVWLAVIVLACVAGEVAESVVPASHLLIPLLVGFVAAISGPVAGQVPPRVNRVSHAVLGVMIGASLSPVALHQSAGAIFPLVVVTVMTVLFSLAAAVVLHLAGRIDRATAFWTWSREGPPPWSPAHKTWRPTHGWSPSCSTFAWAWSPPRLRPVTIRRPFGPCRNSVVSTDARRTVRDEALSS
jgi:cytochrome bd-type quinol oxidase subunit 1